MTARQDTLELQRDLEHRGLQISFDDVDTLRRAQLTLHRWAEQECGDSNAYASFSIERDEDTGIPYRCVYPYTGDGAPRKTRIPDREAGALRRVAAICAKYGAHYYHQGDPRGCALYVGKEPLPDNNYTRGVAICV